jgi:hypothetical protein
VKAINPVEKDFKKMLEINSNLELDSITVYKDETTKPSAEKGYTLVIKGNSLGAYDPNDEVRIN